ncbi:MAG: Holliday junction branch migration protein RuvA [Patescibacteria group bacterium]
MISWLAGLIKYKDDDSIVLDVKGVGYQVFMLATDFKKMSLGKEVELFIHQYQRETGSELYGFIERESQQFFKQLISISGVGPRGALGILAQAKVSDVKKAIVHGDPTVLTKVSGIGKKTAERIIVELKNKIDITSRAKGANDASDIGDDASAIDALEQLGYSKFEAREAVRSLSGDASTVEEKVRQALKALGTKSA